MLESQLLEALPITKDASVKPAMAIEGLEGLSLHRRPFVPLPPICSDSTVHTEETMSRPSDTAGHLSPEHLSDEDTKSTESIFLTQVPLPTRSQFPRVPVQPLDGWTAIGSRKQAHGGSENQKATPSRAC